MEEDLYYQHDQHHHHHDVFEFTFVSFPLSSSFNHWLLNIIMSMFTLLPIFIVVGYFVLTLAVRDITTLYFFMGQLVNVVLNKVLKLLINQPRPDTMLAAATESQQYQEEEQQQEQQERDEIVLIHDPSCFLPKNPILVSSSGLHVFLFYFFYFHFFGFISLL